MNRLELILCSEAELENHLRPIDDQMQRERVPVTLRAMKGWHLFMNEHQLEIPLRDPASDRVISWFRSRVQ